MSRIRRTVTPAKYLPDAPGRYFWSEWKAAVDVYRASPRSKALWVKPPGKYTVAIRITPYTAGRFYPI